MLTGKNSILSKAGEASEITNQKQVEERVKLAYNAALMEDKNNGNRNVQENTLFLELAKEFPGSTIEIDLKGEKWKINIDNANPVEVQPGDSSINETEINNQISTAYVIAKNTGEKTKSQITKEVQENIDSTKSSILITPCGKNTKILYVRTDNKYLMTPDGQIKKYEKTPVTEVWYKIVGTTIYFRNNNPDDSYFSSYSNSVLTSSQQTMITKAVFETEVVPNNVENWFGNYQRLAEIEHLDYLDTSNSNSLVGMFGNCKKLKALDVSGFDTSNVTDMSFVFMHCHELENINLLNWDTSNTVGMGAMFSNCLKLKSLDLSDFDTHKVNLMENMFNYCQTLTSLDLRYFDTSKVSNMRWIFRNCTNLQNIQVSSLWQTAELHTDMFLGCGTNQLTLDE